MAVFGVLLKKDNKAKAFFEMVNNKLENLTLVENPFIARIIEVKEKKDGLTLYIIIMKPIYFNFCVFGWIVALTSTIFLGVNWLLIPSILLGLGSIFWMSRFYYYILKLGLKKNGFQGKLRYITPKDILEYIYLD